MPSRRKPDHLKALTGTLRADRASSPSVDLPLVETAPEPPEWLKSPRAIAEWRRLAATLTEHKLLTEASLGTFGVLCGTFGTLVEMIESGQVPKSSLLSTYRNLANDFGLSALAIQKIQPPPPERENPFAELAAGFTKTKSPRQ